MFTPPAKISAEVGPDMAILNCKIPVFDIFECRADIIRFADDHRFDWALIENLH